MVGKARVDPAKVATLIIIASVPPHLISLPADQPSPTSTTPIRGECSTGNIGHTAFRDLCRGSGSPEGELDNRGVRLEGKHT